MTTTALLREDAMRERFTRNTAEHTMEVLLDNGLHRHLRFTKPGTNSYWFEIVTWPGTLTIRGDMGSFVFARLPDMLEFFRGQRINPQYWAEKEQTGAPTARFDEKFAAKLIRENVSDEELAEYEPEDVQSIQAAALALVHDFYFGHEAGARQLIADFEVQLQHAPPFSFYDTWEWDLTDWTAQFLWCCHAIVWAIKQYDAAKAES